MCALYSYLFSVVGANILPVLVRLTWGLTLVTLLPHGTSKTELTCVGNIKRFKD